MRSSACHSNITKIGIPKDKLDLQKLLGMINYVWNYIPNLSGMCQPFVKKKILFDWHPIHTIWLEKIKKCIMDAPVLKAFDSNKEIKLQTEASQSGLGCCLMQDGKPTYIVCIEKFDKCRAKVWTSW